jgi:dTDP-glucose 4,6-dehydratase
MNIKNKKILVTGSDGFIGSHLVERLVNLGCSVKAFVYYNSFNSYGWLDTVSDDVMKNVEIFMGDVRDPNGVAEAVKGCDIVMHLAALIGIPFSYHSPASYVDTNIKGTLNILNACRLYGTSKVIVTSTSEVYGTAQYVPIDENHPLQGQSPYSATKIGADQLALSFFRSFNLPVSVLRPFNTFGPRQSARAIIPTIISQLLSGSQEIHVGSIHPTRDFTYVTDTAEGFINMAESDEILGEVVNLGVNFEISVEELLKKLMHIMKRKIPIVSEDVRKRPPKSEVERLWSNNKKAKTLMGWKPKVDFDHGLRLTVEWFREHGSATIKKSNLYTV